MKTIAQLERALDAGHLTSLELTHTFLTRIEEEGGEGSKAFISVNRDQALLQATAMDRARASGTKFSPLMGIPISVKDLFDVEGQTTRAGSKVFSGAAPASQDAIAIERLRKAGAVLIGRTNMTEFAYSGLGLNPHYGTPANPYDRKNRRIPGGSTSGGAVSVTDGMAAATIGTDTGGSVRIPAALCGISGFKPTADRIPLKGTFPLSSSLDSIGSMAPSVACCATIDAIMTGQTDYRLDPFPLSQCTLLKPTNFFMDGLDSEVQGAFEEAVSRLIGAGVRIVEKKLSAMERLPALFEKGGLAAAESYAHHRRLFDRTRNLYDPRVAIRIEAGATLSAADYIDLLARRARFIRAISEELQGFHGIISPTTAIIAPRMEDLVEDENYFATNLLMLRNSSVVNQFDGCSFSIPCHSEGQAPVGLMVSAIAGLDASLLSMGVSMQNLMPNPLSAL